MATKWEFEGDYFTWCNCDWGCPCNFNARPTHGDCHGGGVYGIRRGRFGDTKLDGVNFALFYWFPGLIEKGNGAGRTYIDERAAPDQRQAIELIATGTAGGGVFELFHHLCSKWHPTIVTRIDFDLKDGRAETKVGDFMEAECDLLSYPDGTVIRPTFTLPHGIEFKTALATNTKRWWIRDGAFRADHVNVYGAVAKVKFTEKGCIG